MDSGIEHGGRNFDAPKQDHSSDTGFLYRKLRSPNLHGQSLQIPSLSSVDQVWHSNAQVRANASELKICDVNLAELQKIGRAELMTLATKYTNRYLDVDYGLSVDKIVMAGHQPELFHPGVWYKNFVLSNLGRRFNCAAINLVIDNDICGSTSIRFPRVSQTSNGAQISIGTIPIDAPGPNEPFEARRIQDWSLFADVAARAEAAMGVAADSLIVSRLWPRVIKAAQQMSADQPGRLGEAIAAGRHLLEDHVGLKTLEIPISLVAKTESFAMFAKSILINASRFQRVYNDALFEYRRIHGIRSRSHPVPEMETVEGWTESPFWVWQKDEPTRRRLFTQHTGDRISLSDLTGFEKTMEPSAFVNTFRDLEKEGIAIRPKALMTTLFSRLVLCDLFLHGIGGSKYDQLTDVIAARYFSARLPEFLTLSATMKLPTDFTLVNRSDVVDIDQQIRELKFHPEAFISSPATGVVDLINQKSNWTVGEHRGERSKRKHDAIEALNQQLARFVDIDPAALLAARVESVQKIRAGEILGSREYSFCLFSESLIDQLKALATV